MNKIMFVCTANTCRSAMTHHYMQWKVEKLGIEKNFLIDSCGIYANTGEKATYNAILAMKNIGIPMDNHRTKSIYDVDLKDYDLILCMTNSHKQIIKSSYSNIKNKVYTLKEYIGEKDTDIKDPYGYGNIEYENCLKEIVYCVDKLIQKF